MRLAINAGHCPGLDSGAVNRNTGLQEADITKTIAEKTVKLLKDAGHNALFIQYNELFDIVQKCNDFGSQLFISIHCNAAENTAAHGTETFCYPGSDGGYHLASYIQSALTSDLGLQDRGVKEAKFYVLRNTNCPAVLIELCFISNDTEAALLASESWQQRAAEAIVKGVQRYGD